MNDLPFSSEPIEEIESLIRAAGNYVQPSEDLRPRVLEAARSQRSQWQAMTIAQCVAAAVVVLGMFLMSGSSTTHKSEPAIFANRLANEFLPPLASDGDWGLVDSFTELRRRQAEMLRSVSDVPPRKA